MCARLARRITFYPSKPADSSCTRLADYLPVMNEGYHESTVQDTQAGLRGNRGQRDGRDLDASDSSAKNPSTSHRRNRIARPILT